jgi:alpha-tubulin suppressor-like RCC1 family protein
VRGVLPVTRIEGLADVAGLAIGRSHVCAVRAWGGVACWGKDEEGELGDGAFTDRAEPVDVQGLVVPAVAVAVGSAHSCALLRNGTVHCWGANAKNQLADGTQAHRASPLLVNGLFDTQAIAAAGDATCARFADGAARCWGRLPLPKTPGDVMPVPTEVRW